MLPFWPFKSKGGRILDLKAPELTEAALKAFHLYGKAPISMRLLYRTLELNPHEPHALLILSELFHTRGRVGRPTGDEIFSGLIIEYAMDPKTLLAKNQKPAFDKARNAIMTSWGFITARGHESEPDHIGYMAFINQLLAQVRSVAQGFKLAHSKLGLQIGAIDPAKGKHTLSYTEWLRSSSDALRF